MRMKRKLSLVCGIFIASAVFGAYFGRIRIPALIFSSAALLLSVVLRFVSKKKRIRFPYKTAALISAPMTAALAVTLLWYGVYLGYISSFAGKENTVTATVTKIRYETSYSGEYEIRITGIDGRNVGFGAILRNEFVSNIAVNDRIRVRAVLSEPEEFSYGFPQRMYNRSKGLMLTAESAPNTLENLGDAGFSPGNMFSSLNSVLTDRTKRLIGGESSGLVSAILLGNRTECGEAIRRDFRRIGLSHLLAVSGLHMTVLIGMIEKILRLLRLKAAPRFALLSFLSLLLLGITGFQISALRSVIMLLIFYGSYYASREPDPLTSLTFSVALIMLFSPRSILDIGLLLSFTATLGLITVAAPVMTVLHGHFKGKAFAFAEKGIGTIVTAVSVLMFTLPLMWLYFGEASILSPLSNLIFLPLSVLLMMIAPTALIFGDLGIVGLVPVRLCRITAALMIRIASGMAKIPSASVSLHYGFAGIAVAALLITAVVLLIVRPGKLRYRFLPFAAALMIFIPCMVTMKITERGKTEILYLSQGKNEAFAVKSGGISLYCDISDGSYAISRGGLYMVGDRFCECETDVYMITHLHKRHISTLETLLDNDYIGTLLLPSPENEEEAQIAAALADIAAARNCRVSFFDTGEELIVGNLTVAVSEKMTLKRSSQPVFGITLQCGDEKIRYLSASYPEAVGTDGALTDCAAVIFGIHGPNVREPLPDAYRVSAAVVCASEEDCGIYGIVSDLLPEEERELAVLPLQIN